ncbi:MAG: alpha/beta fold hydrolase [Synechococcales cyanobacterium CRU_2_2]|nr:alpha/beta fold hydrolase [Synechococcales cyanobacterium CRU_2_2]
MQNQSIQVGSLNWFYRESEPVNANAKPPVVLLHGLVCQSYGWRKVMPPLTEQGFRCLAPDWIGSGKSDWPEKRDFAYTPDAYVQALGDWLDALELAQVSLVVQGFLGSVGLQYALRNCDRIHRIAILNAPIHSEARVPFKLQQMGWPVVGDMMTQDPLLVDRTLEGGGGYVVTEEDLGVYRKPFLTSSAAGRALKATINNLNLAQATAEISQGLASWEKPVLLVWGSRDPWLPLEQARSMVKTLPDGKLEELEEVGHYPQQDWPEKVSSALLPFLRFKDI